MLIRLLPGIMEAVLLAMVCASPWAYGSVHPGFEFLLSAGVGLLLILWGLRILFQGQLGWKKCPVLLCLALLFLIGIWQIVPLDKFWLDAIDPSAARLYARLLPSQPEQLPFGEENAVLQAGSTISLYPHATRLRLQRILAVVLVFAIVRNNLTSLGAVRRLAMAVLLNGALLSLFALLQFFSSPPSWLFWTYQMSGAVFGPFICRNHFPFYLNLCIGLGMGVLWSRRLAQAGTVQGAAGPDANSGALWRARSHAALRLLHDPASLGICLALALMVSSVAFSLSRGGFLALVGGFSVCLLIKMTRSAGFLRPATVLLCLMVAVGLLGWFGLARVQARLTTLWGGTALQESRVPVWSTGLAMVRDFPVWGTGYGTYQYLDPLYRTNAEFADYVVDHVHNDYLEMLVEGGLIGLCVSLLAIALVFRLGWRAIKKGRKTSGFALGALFAFTTLVFHSVGDFGIHIPAITLLATVLCAHLSALGSPHGTPSSGPTSEVSADIDRYTLRWGGVAPVLGSVVCVALAMLVLGSGWKLYLTDSLRLGAFRAGEMTDPDKLERKKDYLEAAARLTPDDSELRTELGEAYADIFREYKEALSLRNKALEAAGSVAGLAPSGPVVNSVPAIAPVLMTELRQNLVSAEERRWQRQYLVPALRNFLHARDQGPLLPGSHLELALHADTMARADPPDLYRSRVRLLAPSDPALWYYCGNQELRSGQPQAAWKSWRHCLELSDRYRGIIIERSAKILGPDALLNKLLPDQPEMLLNVALSLYPRPEALARRAPFLQKALVLLGGEPSTLTNLHTKAKVHESLGQTAEAVALYQTILAREPLQLTWRLEFATILYEAGQLREARVELLTLLAHQPKHRQAHELLTRVTKELLSKEVGRQ